MSERMVRIGVRILEKDYQVACLPEERTELLDSAEFVNQKMREIRDSASVVGLDRIAVMAALNLANELLRLRKQDQSGNGEAGQRIRHVRERVESAITQGRQLEL
ncbi:MAG TPA: cell division protein ZapA [Steroidobacteraceae bacterium]|nr:cell division protein ZapA [Steroidobacteraceae bacterium]